MEYHGIRPTDPGGYVGLRNPERGFRIETVAGELADAPEWIKADFVKGKTFPRYADDWWIADAENLAPFGLSLAQVYIYLDAFTDKDISKNKLDAIQSSLSALRKRGYKALLRFAYMRHEKAPNASPELIERHLDQLSPLIAENSDVIYVLQAGFIGPWGEWHTHTSSDEAVKANCANLVQKILEVLPTNLSTQVRVPFYKRWALTKGKAGVLPTLTSKTAHTDMPAARIGVHNDGFLAGPTDGGTWPEEPHFGSPGNPEYDILTQESAYVPVDGELFWVDYSGEVDGFEAILALRRHHYSSFSIAHSHSAREGKPYSIDKWMVTSLTKGEVEEAKLPLSDGYFTDIYGNEVSRTQFEYIRDHFGYRIELVRASFPEKITKGQSFSLELSLINRGFSALDNPRTVEFILIAPSENVVELGKADVDPRTWQPYEPGDPDFVPLVHKICFSTELRSAVAPGWYKLALWFPDFSEKLRKDPAFAIKTANRDTPWWTNSDGQYGANVLGIVHVE